MELRIRWRLGKTSPVACFDIRQWIAEQPGQLRELILALEAQWPVSEAELAARVQHQPLPKGPGDLSLATLTS